MNEARRAIARVVRKPKESMAFIALFLLIVTSTTLCAYVADALRASADGLREKAGASFTVCGSPAARQEEGDDDDGAVRLEPVRSQDIDRILEIEGIAASNSRQSCVSSIEGLALPSGMDSGVISTNTNSSLNRRFREGTIRMLKGRHIESGGTGVALISEELAFENGLGLGDDLGAGSPISRVQVIGIYCQGESEEYNPDEIIVDTQTYLRISGDDPEAFVGYADFFVENPSEAERLMLEAKELASVQGSDYIFKANATAYDSAMRSLSRIEDMVFVLTCSTLAVGAALIVAAVFLRLRGRLKEIATFRALGFPGRRILGQFALELLLLLSVAAIASLPFIGYGIWLLKSTFLATFDIALPSVDAAAVMLLYAFEALAIGAGLLVGMYPKLRPSPAMLLAKTR